MCCTIKYSTLMLQKGCILPEVLFCKQRFECSNTSSTYSVVTAGHSFLTEQNLTRIFPKPWWRFYSQTIHYCKMFFYVAEKTASGNAIFEYVDKL